MAETGEGRLVQARGDWLKALARARQLEDKQALADAINAMGPMRKQLQRQTVRRWFMGGWVDRDIHRFRLAAVLGVTEDQIANGPWVIPSAPVRDHVTEGTEDAPPATGEEKGSDMVARDIVRALEPVLRQQSVEVQLLVLGAIIAELGRVGCATNGLGAVMAKLYRLVDLNRREPPQGSQSAGGTS
jgi:hypothetical protein